MVLVLCLLIIICGDIQKKEQERTIFRGVNDYKVRRLPLLFLLHSQYQRDSVLRATNGKYSISISTNPSARVSGIPARVINTSCTINYLNISGVSKCCCRSTAPPPPPSSPEETFIRFGNPFLRLRCYCCFSLARGELGGTYLNIYL